MQTVRSNSGPLTPDLILNKSYRLKEMDRLVSIDMQQSRLFVRCMHAQQCNSINSFAPSIVIVERKFNMNLYVELVGIFICKEVE